MAQIYTMQMRERLGETAPISVPRQPAQPAGIQDAAAPATPPNGEQVLMGESPQHSPLLRLPMPEMRSPMPALQLSSETVVGDDDSCANSYADFHADSYASDTASDSEVDSDSDSDTIAEQYHDFALDKRANAVAPAVAPAPPAAAKCETERPASPPAPPAGLVQGAVRLPLGVAGVAPPTQDPTPPAPRNGGAVLLLVMEACGFAAAVVRGRSSSHACMPSSLCEAIIRGCSVSGIHTPMVLLSVLPLCALSLAASEQYFCIWAGGQRRHDRHGSGHSLRLRVLHGLASAGHAASSHRRRLPRRLRCSLAYAHARLMPVSLCRWARHGVLGLGVGQCAEEGV